MNHRTSIKLSFAALTVLSAMSVSAISFAQASESAAQTTKASTPSITAQPQQHKPAFLSVQEMKPVSTPSATTNETDLARGASDHDNTYFYDSSRQNIVSSTQINMVYFKVPVKNIIQPPSQNGVDYHLLDDNQVLAFTLTGGQLYSTVQFSVIFDNDHPPVSLKFMVANVDGKVIEVPLTVSGGIPTQDTYGHTSHYDQMIINMNKAFVTHNTGDFWTLQDKIAKPFSPYKQFTLSDYAEYSSSNYTMREWKICPNELPLSLSESEFYQDKSAIVSITLTRHDFASLSDCGNLYILLQKPSDNQDQAQGLLSPVNAGGQDA